MMTWTRTLFVFIYEGIILLHFSPLKKYTYHTARSPAAAEEVCSQDSDSTLSGVVSRTSTDEWKDFAKGALAEWKGFISLGTTVITVMSILIPLASQRQDSTTVVVGSFAFMAAITGTILSLSYTVCMKRLQSRNLVFSESAQETTSLLIRIPITVNPTRVWMGCSTMGVFLTVLFYISWESPQPSQAADGTTSNMALPPASRIFLIVVTVFMIAHCLATWIELTSFLRSLSGTDIERMLEMDHMNGARAGREIVGEEEGSRCQASPSGMTAPSASISSMPVPAPPSISSMPVPTQPQREGHLFVLPADRRTLHGGQNDQAMQLRRRHNVSQFVRAVPDPTAPQIAWSHTN